MKSMLSNSLLGARAIVAASALTLSIPFLSAQQTTGTVSGVVHDTTGALIPSADVVLKNIQDNSERKVTASASGNFSIPSVESGLQYQVMVTKGGFGTWESQIFPLRPGDEIGFTDIKLAAGEATAEVTVEAVSSQAIKPLDTAERSDIITAKDLETLSIEGRDATELIRTLPGFSLVNPGLNNQGPDNSAVGVNSAATGNYSANGTGTTGIATILDGVSLTDIGSNQTTTQTINSEMVAEVKVDSSNFSADYAHGPVVINAVTKSGTTKYHGEGYIFARDSALNANDWYNNFLGQARPAGQYFYPGGTIGGPLWIPHTRFHRDNTKLFFFAGFEYVSQLFSPETLGAWVPTMAQRQGDFSTASLNAQLCGSRPDGAVNPNAIQPMCNAMNFLPSGASVASSGNLSTMGNANGIALLNWMALPNADPFTNVSGYNYEQEVLQHQNGSVFHTRVDYAINDNDKLYLTYGRQSQVTEDPVAYGYAPTDSTLFPGGVSTGDISNIFSLTYTHVFNSSITNEFNAAVSLLSQPANESNPAAVGRFSINGYNCTDPTKRSLGTCGTSGNGNFNELGEFNSGDYSVPAVSDFSELGYPNVLMPGGFYNNQVHLKKEVPDFQDTVNLVRGPHFFRFGLYYEKGIINGLADYGTVPQGEYTFNPQSSGYDYNSPVGTAAQFQGCVNASPLGNNRLSGAADLGECITPNAMLYLGYADTYTQTNFAPVVDMQYTTLSGFINDSWKLKHVTLELGIRLEHLGPWTDRHNNGLATFQPSLYQSECAGRTCGSQNDPGITWHDLNKAVANSVSSPALVYASPRLGVAWDVFGKGNTVIRGGWGIYRHEEEFSPYALAAATAQSYKTTFLTAGSQPLTFSQISSQSPVNPQDFSVYTLAPNDTMRPTYYEYNGALSQRISWNRAHLRESLLEVAYVGSNSQHLSTYNSQASGYNEASDLNLIPAGFFFGAPGSSSDLSNLTSAGFTLPDSIASLTTAETDFFRPYPFYNHIYTLKHNFYANYNSLQVSWNKSTGIIQFGLNYTFSKNLATAASYSNLVPDPGNLRNDYNPVPFDRTEVFNSHYLADLGKRYRGDSKWLAGGLNGWQLSGISSVQSGPPLFSVQGNFGFGYGAIQPQQVASPQQESRTAEATCENTYGIPGDSNGNHFCVTNVNPVTWLGTPDYQLLPTVNCNPRSGLKANQFINPTCFGVPTPGGPSDGPYAQKLPNQSGQGQLRLPYLHGPAYSTNDLTLLKNFPMKESRNLQFRVAAFNFLNHPLTSFNNNDTSNLNLGFQGATAGQALTTSTLLHPNFGIANIKYGFRRMEFGAKYQF